MLHVAAGGGEETTGNKHVCCQELDISLE